MLKNTQQIAVKAVQQLSKLTRLRVIKISHSLKKMTAITALVMVMILAGNSVSAQLNSSLRPLGKVGIPKPDNIEKFIKDKTAAIALGKTLFWDMQLGSDGIQSCASCHFHAGADSRSKNQINPGSGNTFDIASAANYQLKPSDYPFHKLEDPNNRSSKVISDVNDIAGSQGVSRARFIDVQPGSDKDKTTPVGDEVFNVNNVNVRRVTARNTPTVINSVFNFRNFWDGRAQNIFNGVNPSGLRDPNAFVLQAGNRRRLTDVQVKINNSSLASQAVGPPVSSFELSAEVEPVIVPSTVELSDSENQIEIRDRRGRTINRGSAIEGVEVPAENELDRNRRQRRPRRPRERRIPRRPRPQFRSLGRKLGKKMLAVTPLNKQIVAGDDSVLGSFSKFPKPGLNKSYEEMIQQAFQRQWWDSNIIIRVNPETGRRSFRRKPRRKPLSTNEFTLAEYNFALFFGLAVQEYESTLISDQTPFDRFLGGDKNALTPEQQKGWEIFQNKGLCINCHVGSELTSASVSNVASQQRIVRPPIPNAPVADTGFINIGVRPVAEDLGVGGKDQFDNPLSEARLALQGTFKRLLGEKPPIIPNNEQDISADGAFKTSGLRNVELTAPYFHNGGQLTLEQVIDFYNRGGDFGRNIPPLNLSAEEKQSLVAFLKGLTDERVRNQKAPFDHPQLFVPNGHPNDEKNVIPDPDIQGEDGTKQGKDDLLEIPAVGRGGSKPLPNFLEAQS